MPSLATDPSRPLALLIAHAGSLAELQTAAAGVDALIEALHAAATPVEQIATAVRDLNRPLFARLWALLAPPALVANSCLIVMGSEGRGEQILKTDQDNALLLRDGYVGPAFGPLALSRLTARFTAALIELGYPRCPGNIMLSQPLWCQPVAAFRASLGDWLFGAAPDGAMNLAIFLDAATVAGDARLLAQARAFVDDFLVDDDAFFARFASAVDQFGADPGASWWARLTGWRAGAAADDDMVFDLKKIGLFPLVHGVRALALQYRISVPGTAARLAALAARGLLPELLASELTQALHQLMALKLDHNLRQLQAARNASDASTANAANAVNTSAVGIDNLVALASLTAAQREALQNALAAVKNLRQHLRLHYRLGAL